MKAVLLLSLLAAVFCLEISTQSATPYLIKWSSSSDGKVVAGLRFVKSNLEDPPTSISLSKNYGHTYDLLSSDLYTNVVVSGDGRWIAATNTTNLALYDATSLKLLSLTPKPCQDCEFEPGMNINIQINNNATRIALQFFTPSPTFYIYTRDTNGTLSLLSQHKHTYNRISFSPTMETFVASRSISEVEEFRTIVEWGAVDLNNQNLTVSTEGVKVALQDFNILKMADNGIVLISDGSDKYCLLNTTSKELTHSWDSPSENYLDLADITQDGRYLFTFASSGEALSLRRYLLVNQHPLPFDSVEYPNVTIGEGITINSQGSVLIAGIIVRSNVSEMRVSQITGGGVSSICSVASECGDGLLCGRGYYCYSNGTRAQTPSFDKFDVEVTSAGLLIDFKTSHPASNLTTCEKAGSISAGSWGSEFGPSSEYFMYNNTFVDVMYNIPDTELSWTNIGYVPFSGTFSEFLTAPANYTSAQIRIRVQCEDENMTGVDVIGLHIHRVTSAPPSADSGGGVYGVMAGVIGAALLLSW